jgi:LPXTG-motif cell wall-anchored protein
LDLSFGGGESNPQKNSDLCSRIAAEWRYIMLRYKRLLRLLFSILLLCCISITSYADGVPDVSRKGSISVTMRYNGNTVSGGTLTIYRVGELSQSNGAYSFALTSDFIGSGQSLASFDNSLMAGTLARYAANANLSGTTESIGSTGTVSFTDLELGVYLITQDKAATGYNAISSFLVSVPMAINGSYEYDVDASPKVELTKRSGGGGGSSSSSKATATPKPTATPSGRNSSSGSIPTPTPAPGSTATPIPRGSSGTPDNPDASVQPGEPTPTEEITTSSDPNSPSESAAPGAPSATDDPDAGDKPKLPQTGQLNWPIPVLAVLGLAAFTAGWILRYKKRKHNG